MGLKVKIPKLLLFSALLLFISSCGNRTDENSEDEILDIPVSLTPQPLSVLNTLDLYAPDSFNLAAPGGLAVDSYVITLTNCKSGLAGNNATAGILRVYVKDQNCVAKLSSFVLRGSTYTPTTNFTTWAAGDNAVFSNGITQINVKVVQQLSSPIQATDEVSYNFAFISSGVMNASMSVSNPDTITAVGQDAPNFALTSGNGLFMGIVMYGPNAGYGLFKFNLTCATGSMTVGANATYNSFCPTLTAGGTIAGGANGIDIGVANQFSYKLIADPNGNGTLTLTQARAAFAAGGDSTVTLSTDILAGDLGFTTNTLTGPGPLMNNLRLILILQGKNPSYPTNPNYSSFQYFPITLPTSN